MRKIPSQFTFKELKQVAEEKLPIKLLSTSSNGRLDKLLWKCLKCETKFNTIWANIHAIIFRKTSKGWGCPKCATDNSGYIEEIKKITEMHGVVPTNKIKYSISTKPIEWKCDKGHKFIAKWDLLRCLIKAKTKNKLCRCCANRKLSSEFIQSELDRKGSKLKIITKKVNSVKDRIILQCLVCKNKMKTNWDAIQKLKNGCSKCSGFKKYTFKEVKTIIKEKLPKAELVSKTYTNCKKLLKLHCTVCSNDWKMNFDNIKNSDQGCPECRFMGFKEQKIRNFLNLFFDDSFKKIKPEWLINPKTNQRMEIDCYSTKYNLAIEINGHQHYQYEAYFHKTANDLKKIKYRDRIKKQKIKARNINFIEVNLMKLTKEDHIKKYLLKVLIKLNYRIDIEKWEKTRFEFL